MCMMSRNATDMPHEQNGDGHGKGGSGRGETTTQDKTGAGVKWRLLVRDLQEEYCMLGNPAYRLGAFGF